MAAAAIFGTLISVFGVATMGLWREVAVVEARVKVAGALPIDGPEIGALAAGPIRSYDALYLFLSDDCPACNDFVADLPPDGESLDFAVRAIRVRDEKPRDPSSEEEFAFSLPRFIETVPDGLANNVVREFAVRATPLAVAVRNGLVASKGYLRGTADMIEVARPLASNALPQHKRRRR